MCGDVRRRDLLHTESRAPKSHNPVTIKRPEKAFLGVNECTMLD